jgi:nucleotide-binding universal stress UspA family protein
MFERIMVPLDGSELAEVALPYAEELCGRLGSDVRLVYVSEPQDKSAEHMHKFYMEEVANTTRANAEKYVGTSGKNDVHVMSKILSGNPAEEIVDYADRADIGLIVISTHGRSGVKRWALGSVADKVVRATGRPVILVRANGARPDVREKGTLREILVPLDGSQDAETVLPYVENLASRLKGKVTLLRVLAQGFMSSDAVGKYMYFAFPEAQMKSISAEAREYLGQVAERLQKKGIKTAIEVRLSNDVKSANDAMAIIDFAREANADLVAMSTHGRSGVSRWVLGSVAERVLGEGSTPLLLVRTQGDAG